MHYLSSFTIWVQRTELRSPECLQVPLPTDSSRRPSLYYHGHGFVLLHAEICDIWWHQFTSDVSCSSVT